MSGASEMPVWHLHTAQRVRGSCDANRPAVEGALEVGTIKIEEARHFQMNETSDPSDIEVKSQ